MASLPLRINIEPLIMVYKTLQELAMGSPLDSFPVTLLQPPWPSPIPPTQGFHYVCLCCFPTESCNVLLPHLYLAPFHAAGLTSAPGPGLPCSHCLQSPCSPGTLSPISFLALTNAGHIFFLICIHFPSPPPLPFLLHPPLQL